MRAAGFVIAALTLGCIAGPRPVAQVQLEALSMRRYEAAYDEVFDASALAAEQLGYALREVDVSTGAIVATRADGSGYRFTVESRDGLQLVIALPIPERERWLLDGADGEHARWDELETRTRRLLEAWREVPEWEYLAGPNLVRLLDFQARPPANWLRVERSVSRRALVVQQTTQRRGFNPTLRFDVTRRRPTEPARASLIEAVGVALGAKGRLAWPDAARAQFDESGLHGDAAVLDGAVARTISWHLWDQRSPAWIVRVVAVCPVSDRCDDVWHALTQSIVAPGFEPVRDRLTVRTLSDADVLSAAW